jgi:hypothetical protein
VTVCFAREWPRDRVMVLAWATFVVGVSWGYLFAEAGGKMSAGDFLWSGQIAAFVLFAAAAAFLLRQLAPATGRLPAQGVLVRGGVCLAVLGWHVASGLRHLQTSWYD